MQPEHLSTPAASERVQLRIGGFVPFTTTDYPGTLSAVVFCQGCPWRCVYCHNPHLLPADGPESHRWPDILAFLERRRGLLDAVVFSGGEPTLQSGLADAMGEVRAMGFRIGLHTAGMYPQRLARLLPLVDWIGLDVKAPQNAYPRLTGVPGSGAAVFESLGLIRAAGVACELRCTWHPELLSRADLDALGGELRTLGMNRVTLQACLPRGRAEGRTEISTAQADSVTGLPGFEWRWDH